MDGKFDFASFEAVQERAYGAVRSMLERHTAKFKSIPVGTRMEAFLAQRAAQDEIVAWRGRGYDGPVPDRRPRAFGGDVAEALDDCRRDMRIAYMMHSQSVYTCLPYDGEYLNGLHAAMGREPMYLDRIVDGTFAASGAPVLDYMLRAASRGGLRTLPGEDGRKRVELDSDPFLGFDGRGDGIFRTPCAVYALDASSMMPELALEMLPDGDIGFTAFGQEWLYEGAGTVPVTGAWASDRMPAEYFRRNQLVVMDRDLSAESVHAAREGSFRNLIQLEDPGRSGIDREKD